VVLILDTFIVIKVVLKNRLKKEVNELFRLSYSLTMAERIILDKLWDISTFRLDIIV